MFSNELENELSKIGSLTLNYDIFKNVCMDVVNKYAPLKRKYIRENQVKSDYNETLKTPECLFKT